MRITVIAAALPPQLDGIGDYTAMLAAELAKSATVTVLTGAPKPEPIFGVRIETAFSASEPRSVRRLVSFVAADRPEWVLLQYNPFCYGRWGLNLHLPEVMHGIRQRCPSTRVAVMVHEPFVPIITPQFAVMATWQRWQLWRLGQAADILFYSIDAWQRKFQRWFPGKRGIHLPVGSNISLVPIGREEARARLGIDAGAIVLGLFGTASSGRLLDRVRNAADTLRKSGHLVQILYIGPDKDKICVALGSSGLIADGPFPGEEVSRRFAAMDIYLAAYIDGISTRRGALMAALQHGVATVATRGPATDPLLEQENEQALLLVNVEDSAAYNAAVEYLARNSDRRRQLGQGAQIFYQRQLSWESIAARLLYALNGKRE